MILPLIITISDTCKNQPKRLDSDSTINLSSLIVSLDLQGCANMLKAFKESHRKILRNSVTADRMWKQFHGCPASGGGIQ